MRHPVSVCARRTAIQTRRSCLVRGFHGPPFLRPATETAESIGLPLPTLAFVQQATLVATVERPARDATGIDQVLALCAVANWWLFIH